jgi:osmoprotectant transport system ATP-binding protein
VSQIALEDVRKSYGEERALDGVSLRFAEKATTAVVGASGGGKTTLLQLVNGVVRPSAGTVRVFGRPIDYGDLPRLRLRIGYAVQGTGLFPHMTVVQNVTLLGRLQRWPEDRLRARARALMDLVELPEAHAGRYPHELSGGQQQRVGLCRAMMLDPPIFLLDEPFGALDAVTKNEIHGEFARLQRSEPRTVVMVTHDLREAVRLADYIVVLHEGRVIQHGTREEVVERPADDIVRDLFRAQLA